MRKTNQSRMSFNKEHPAVQEGFIPQWLVCGPFASGKDAFYTDFLKENGGEKKIEPGQGLTHSIGAKTVRWQEYTTGENYYEFQINPINTINEVFWNKPGHRGGKGIFGWDLVGIKHAVQVQGTLNCPEIKDEGWTVELALP